MSYNWAISSPEYLIKRETLIKMDEMFNKDVLRGYAYFTPAEGGYIEKEEKENNKMNECNIAGMFNVSGLLEAYQAVLAPADNKKNPYIPKKMDVNEELGTVTVHWEDGTATVVVCSPDDTFSPDGAFAQALKYKVFGNSKNQFKKKFWNIIAHKIVWTGNNNTSKETEHSRVEFEKYEKKAENARKRSHALIKRMAELEKELSHIHNQLAGEEAF